MRAARSRLTLFLSVLVGACGGPRETSVPTVGASSQPVLHIPSPTAPVDVAEALTMHRGVRVVVRLSQCWKHAICARSAPLWAKSAMLEEFRLSAKEVRDLDGAYFQNAHYYVTRDAQILVAHHSPRERSQQWVERTGHHWSLWREGETHDADGAVMLFVLQPGWIAQGPRAAWIAGENALRSHRLVLGEGPFMQAHFEKSSLSKRTPSDVSDAHVSMALIPDGGAELFVKLGVTNDAEVVAEKIRSILADENGFVLRVATRDVLSGAKVTAEGEHVTISIPVSALQATSLLKLAGAYVGEDAEP